jgi:hypothetical protein
MTEGSAQVRQKPVRPRSQLAQKPQPMLKGRTTLSPFLMLSTALPTSTTSPRFSWPRILPFSTSVRPSYMWRSEPQMFVVVSLMMTSVCFSILESGTVSMLTFFGPWYTRAFMAGVPFERAVAAFGAAVWSDVLAYLYWCFRVCCRRWLWWLLLADAAEERFRTLSAYGETGW